MKLKNKKVLVTGADGFIGSHLVETLLNRGSRVKAFVCYNSFNSWGWLDSLDKKKLSKIEIFTGDIRDPNGTAKAVEGVDIVFHLAALIGIPFSYHSPDSYVDTNVKGTLNVLQAARASGTAKSLVTSTSEVYGTAKSVPIKETHLLQGQSPYSASKIAADKITESFARSFNLPVTTVRPFNTYGPRQSARAIIPTIIIQLLSGRKSISLGSLTPTRDFNYVKDIAEAFIAIAASDNTNGREINVASGSEISVGRLAEKIMKIIGRKADINMDRERVRPADSEVERLLGSNDLMRKLTKWVPRYGLDEGLKETAAWFKDKNNARFYKADIYNV